MNPSWDEAVALWKRMLELSWPIAIQQFLTTLMRTVDIVVTGLFSPAAVAAIGLADLYTAILRRLGSTIGTGAIVLSSQDTGRGAVTTRDEAITQAVLLGAIIGLPFVAIGIFFADSLIRILGANSLVTQLGGTYLLIIFAVAPFRILGFVGISALQGTGDTRTPMYINGTANVLNIAVTVGFGLGVGTLPALGIVGVGLATAVARVFETTVMVLVIATSRTTVSFTRPQNITITRQLLSICLPRFAEQMSTSVASFPFNALLLTFGTEVSAAYHIGRRIYQQLTAPLYRSYSTVTSIIVGQKLGKGDERGARFAGAAIVGFGVVTLAIAGTLLFLGARPLARLFSNDPKTIAYAVEFTRVYAVTMVFFATFFSFAGGLRGAGDTRTPFYAQFTGQLVFMLGFSYVTGIVLEYGLSGVYAGIVLTFVWCTVFVGYRFLWGDWANDAATMITERTEGEESSDS